MTADGAAQFSNGDFRLCNGVVTAARGAGNTIGIAYAVYDARLLAAGVAAPEAALGRVELYVDPSSWLVEGLYRMEIAVRRRQRGAGRRLIQALAATAPEFELNLYNIRPAELDFWIALGCTLRPRPPVWDGIYRLPAGSHPPVVAPLLPH